MATEGKPRVAVVVGEYPETSETYVHWELHALSHDYELLIVSLGPPGIPFQDHLPYVHISNEDEIASAIARFGPIAIHTHYLTRLDLMGRLAERTGVPFTVRSHSFDVLQTFNIEGIEDPERLARRRGRAAEIAAHVNADACAGVLCFPFTRPMLEEGGCRPEKLVDCFPVMNLDLFLDRSPNGRGVMNTGAALPKKAMEDFLRLASRKRELDFTLYALGHKVGELARLNDELGRPVRFSNPVAPSSMPAEYKKHDWLVYTASFELNTVGWPMAIAEAQASGVGVCMANLRPDLKEYVGEAGFLFDTVEQVEEIISRPFPDDLRNIGFELAARSDVKQHKSLLIQLWEAAR